VGEKAKASTFRKTKRGSYKVKGRKQQRSWGYQSGILFGVKQSKIKNLPSCGVYNLEKGASRGIDGSRESGRGKTAKRGSEGLCHYANGKLTDKGGEQNRG